jgi:hypothetical protein
LKYLVPFCLFAIVAGLLFFSLSLSKAEANLQVAIADELKVSGYSFTIAPCKYTYSRYAENEKVAVVVKNLASVDAKFDMGDGTILSVPALSEREYEYLVGLKGGSVYRLYITKIVSPVGGMNFSEQLVLKICKRGGDVR